MSGKHDRSKMDVIYVIVFFAYLVLCLIRCRLRWQRRREALDSYHMDQVTGQVRSGMSEEERREYIRERLIVKKAECESDFSIHDGESNSIVDMDNDVHDQEEKNDVDIDVDVDVEAGKTTTAHTDGTNHEHDLDAKRKNENDNDTENEHNSTIQIPQAICNLASSIRDIITTTDIDPTENLDSTKTCPICFEAYVIGDEICSSRNTACPHVYHAACLTHWLMKHNDCPLCRADYLHAPDTGTGTGTAEE